MKQYTEAERQALIDHAKSWIADADGMRDEIPFGFDDDTEKELSLIKIALASLEAEAAVEITEDLGRLYFRRKQPCALKAGDVLYLAPPAPVVKVLDELNFECENENGKVYKN